MGEHVYRFDGLGGTEWQAQFNEGEWDDAEVPYSCLCTFPGNDVSSDHLSAERVRGLAMLGAAVALAHNAPEELLAYEAWAGCWGVTLPQDLPRWICDEIVRLVREA